MNIYICKAHGVGETFVGVGTCDQIRQSGCLACKHEAARELLQQASDMLLACVWDDAAGQCSYCDAFAAPHSAGCVAAKLIDKISELLKCPSKS